MKQSKLISIMLSVALLGAMLNFPVLAEEQSADAAARIVYDQNFDACTWWEGGTTPTEEEFAETIFYPNAQNVVRVNELQAGTYGRADTDKSLHLGATFQHGYRWEDDGENKIAWGAEGNKFWPIVWGGDDYGRGNNGVSHRLSLNAPEMSADESYMHVSFSAAQDPMPPFDIAGDNGAGLDVAFDYITDNGDVTDKEALRWCENNRRQAVFGTLYEVGVPDTAPMTAGNWINYDYVFHTTAKTVDVYLNGYPVIKGKDISGEVNHATIKGLKKLNFQVRDINVEGNQRKVDVYVDDIKVAYSAAEPVVSPQSVFGEKAKINASEKYVNNEKGVVYNYGQSLDDMKTLINAENGNKEVNLAVEKGGGGRWFETTTSLNSKLLNDQVTLVDPALYIQDGNFFYCYEVKQPQATELQASITEADGSAALTWSGAADHCEKVEIFKDGEKVAERDRTGSYTDAALTAATAHEYRVRELLPDNDVSVLVAPRLSDGTTVVYAENFDSRTWWEENGTTPDAAQFARTPFYKNMDKTEIMETAYTLNAGQSGKENTDKSLHINAKFKKPFGVNEKDEKLPHGTEDGQWNGGFGAEEGIPGNNGVSHRMASNAQKMADGDRYLHVSFATAKSVSDLGTIAGEQGAGFDVSFDFITDAGDSKNNEMLHWYPDNKQGVFGKFYQVRARENAWVYYDYVFDTQTKSMDIYVNGYPTVKARDISNEIKVDGTPQPIKGISRLNFQVRDMNTGANTRDIDVYVDDIKVTYDGNAPVISPYSIFGEAAKIDAPAKYVDNEKGEIYNYGQTFEDVKKYITGEGGSEKTVSLVKETADSTEAWQKLETYESQSLDAVRLNDGRYVSPILYVQDGFFTYRYKVVQDISYDVEKKAAAIQSEKDYTGGVTVVFAAYQNGKLTSAALQTASLAKGSNIVAAGESFATDGAQEMKIMVWNDLDSLHPLYRDLQMALQ